MSYLQIYIQTRNPANLNMQIARNDYPDRALTLEGALGKKKHYQQFQPVITLSKGYTIHWDQAAPAEVTIWLINFNKSVNTLAPLNATRTGRKLKMISRENEEVSVLFPVIASISCLDKVCLFVKIVVCVNKTFQGLSAI